MHMYVPNKFYWSIYVISCVHTQILFLVIDISVQMPSKEDVVNVEGLTFPEDGDTQIFIPPEVLLDEIEKG